MPSQALCASGSCCNSPLLPRVKGVKTMSDITIRNAALADAPRILEIYAYYV